MSASFKPALGSCIVALAAFAADVLAQETSRSGGEARTPSRRTSVHRPLTPDLSKVAAAHPLLSVLEYARQEQAILNRTVHDFTCRLVKRERIDGFLEDYVYIDMWVREEAREGERLVSPLSIYLEFLAPKKVAGRRVLYIDGRNDGRMMVRNGGKHFDYVTANIDPYGESAMDESLVPITQSGFNQILAQMIAVLERHAAADPGGQNTHVEQIKGARLNGRQCNVIRIAHANKQPGLEFHVANVFVDNDLHIPLRVDYSDWPKRPDQPAPQIAEYTYTQLKVNVGLSERLFDPRLLRTGVKK